MLTHLFIRNFVLVTESEIEFHSGMTVMTGETGAGKSIIFDALELAMGARAESSLIRHGSEQAEIVATFSALSDEVSDWLAENELISEKSTDGESLEEHQILLRRTLRKDGRSRAFINGTPATLQSLRELAAMLLDIQGQHAHQRLLKRDEQQHLLDQFAGNDALLKTMRQQFRAWEELRQQQEQLQQNEAERADRLALLEFQLSEFNELNLEENELPQLEEEQQRLANGEQLLQQAQTALYLLEENEAQNVLHQLHQAMGAVDALLAIDPEAETIKTTLEQAVVFAGEAANELRGKLQNYTLDPQRLRWLNERLGTIHDLARKHRIAPEEIPAHRQKLQQQYDELLESDQTLEEIAEKIAEATAFCRETATKLHEQRKSAAQNLEQMVTDEIRTLGMEKGEFRIALEQLPDNRFNATGADQIEFQICANVGGEFQSLAKTASGGELSRISLAIQLSAAVHGKTPTLIFDEVDSGIGGGTAERVGGKLKQLGERCQILCITHLPQVAAQGDQHLRIEKAPTEDETQTISQIVQLSQEERIEEVARMLGGVEITPQTRAHAEEMVGN